jgi:hypothetical protein
MLKVLNRPLTNAGMTQVELAKRLGIRKSAVNQVFAATATTLPFELTAGDPGRMEITSRRSSGPASSRPTAARPLPDEHQRQPVRQPTLPIGES